MGPCRGRGHDRNCTGGRWPLAGCRSCRDHGTERRPKTRRRPQDAGGLSSACSPGSLCWHPVRGPAGRTDVPSMTDPPTTFSVAKEISMTTWNIKNSPARCSVQLLAFTKKLKYRGAYLADIFDELQCWVFEWQVGSRQDREQLWGLRHAPGARHFLLDFLSDGEEVLCQLTGHVFLGEGDHSCRRKITTCVRKSA